ncbi:hypothetical protein [Actinophytocola gossypii]|uniref:Zinc-finger domain-containing protein n=1 Tax=Actinophytocola gossypii TaxID=2812003 RepID=A0ABT2J9P0_9PSEU|nr:hypothetical protein [Actinophytocola gossypii]MCT2584588.1 hypothetical protein [Actinophytocola gossypii]
MIRRQLGMWARGSSSVRRTRLIVSHLASCPDCDTIATMLAEANDELHATARSAGTVTGLGARS